MPFSPSKIPLSQRWIFLIGALLLTHCMTPRSTSIQSESRLPLSTAEQAHFFKTQVQPILNQRCVVCHSCTEAPCQLHLDSYQGVRRGATYADLGANLLYTDPTRDKDAHGIAEWRKKNFFPIIPDPQSDSGNEELPAPRDSEQSLLFRFVQLGSQFNKPGFPLKPVATYRRQTHVCPSNTGAFESLAKEYPYVGMPFGFPGLESHQVSILQRWIDQGAPSPEHSNGHEDRSETAKESIREWESLLNATNKTRLMARYIYEHVFSAHIHFEGSPSDEWYELIRSSTPPSQPVKEIITPRPYDAPKMTSVFYRFQRVKTVISKASHIPWKIQKNTLNQIKDLFLKTPWINKNYGGRAEQEPIQNPGYISTNPFKYFKQIPASMRYQFMLENSHLIANAMIRGPACSGRVATNAIRDHFWVFFLKPEADVTVINSEIGVAEWSSLSELDLKAFTAPSPRYTSAMKKLKPQGFSLNDLWTDQGKNPNAVLTIFRHGTNASVHYGLIGGAPLTYWVLNYSNFERIYYNLVADFEPWGSSAHKASTWNYMSRHRSEAEERFISFLPEDFRSSIRSKWTQGLGKAQNLSQARLSEGIKTSVVLDDEQAPVESLVRQFYGLYSTKQVNPNKQIIKEPFDPVPNLSDIESFEDWEHAFQGIVSNPELPAVRYFPDVIFLRMNDRTYTILNHRYYKFNNLLALEKLAYEPSKNKLFLMRHLIGDRPEYFADLSLETAPSFLRDMQKIQIFEDWIKFKNKYLVRRNQARVWPLSDWFMEWQSLHDPTEAGVYDLREYDTEIDEI